MELSRSQLRVVIQCRQGAEMAEDDGRFHTAMGENFNRIGATRY